METPHLYDKELSAQGDPSGLAAPAQAETAEKKEAVEIARREFLANGGIYNKRPDFDVVKLFEYDMDKNIQNIKNNECKYD